jgi:hypothetical protein
MIETMQGHIGCRVPSDEGIALGDRAAYAAAKIGSDMLRDRMLAYHRRVQPHLFREADRG